MISRKIITGEREMITQIYLKRGAIVPMHSHESEQMTYVLQGGLRFLINGEEITVREGEVLHIPSWVPHQAEAIDDTFEMDIFSPIRHDWLDGTDSYFHDKDIRRVTRVRDECAGHDRRPCARRDVGDERLRQARWPPQPGDQRLAPGRRATEASPRLIANLVDTVTGAVEFEGDTLEAVVAARTRAASASGPADASRKERLSVDGRRYNNIVDAVQRRARGSFPANIVASIRGLPPGADVS